MKTPLPEQGKFEIPRSFSVTRVSPTINELQFIHDWIYNNVKNVNAVLEFGTGVTTWAIYTSTRPKRYVAVEDPLYIKDTVEHLPMVEIVRTTWYDIPEIKYDLIFVDSSAGYPPMTPGLHRGEALKYGLKLASDDVTIILHDWRGKSGRKPRAILDNDNNFMLAASYKGRTGVGVYQRVP